MTQPCSLSRSNSSGQACHLTYQPRPPRKARLSLLKTYECTIYVDSKFYKTAEVTLSVGSTGKLTTVKAGPPARPLPLN